MSTFIGICMKAVWTASECGCLLCRKWNADFSFNGCIWHVC